MTPAPTFKEPMEHATPGQRESYRAWLERRLDQTKRGSRMRECFTRWIAMLDAADGENFYAR